MSLANPQKVAVVVGAQGVIGRSLAAELVQRGDWQVIGLSRRGGESSPRLSHLAVDLLDAAASRRTLAELKDVTHLFYAAYQDRPSWAELVAPNLAMLVNSVEAIEAASPGLQHISLMQGYKVYGAHLGPFKTPAKETDGGHMPPEFNVDQQQFLEARQPGQRWQWSAIRPGVVGGTALGNPMNLVVLIAVYASICKQLGLPLRFPGKPGAYDKIMEMTDAGLLAKATIWAATDPGCGNQAFNVGNGDLFRWSELWPKIARYFGLEVAPPLTLSLATVMADKSALWQRMVTEHGLAPQRFEDLCGWAFGDFVFGWDYDFFGDSSKARRFGFHEYVETEAMFFGLFDTLRQQRIIP